MNGDGHPLRARRLRLLTQDEAIVLMRADCHVCKSEGLAARARVLLRAGTREVIATLYQIENEWLHLDEVGLSETAWQRLNLNAGDVIDVENAPTVESLADVRRRIFGGRLDARAFDEIITDIVAGRYADIHLATFVAACSAFPLDVEEITYLTGAMANAGDKLAWRAPVVIDKHCVGGLPGNRVLAFDTSGVRLASGSLDQTIRVWDTSSRRELWRTSVADEMFGVSFSDGDLSVVALAPSGIYRLLLLASLSMDRRSLVASACATILSGDNDRLSEAELDSAPVLDRSLDAEACARPGPLSRLRAALGG